MSKQTQMKLAAASRRLVVVLAVVAVTAFVTNAVVTRAGDEPKKDHEKEMAEWMAANQLTPMHDKLKMFVGEWECKNTMYMEPGAPGQTSKAESDTSLVYGGRYIRQSYKGSFDMPGPDGKMMSQKFEGYSVVGYDAMKKKFVSIWIDSMSTGIYMETGDWDDANKQFVFNGDMPMPNGKTCKNKSTLKFSDKDHYVMEMNMEVAPGQWHKHMVIEYARDD